MQTRKIIGSLTNMEIPQLPVSLLQHMEQIGLLPRCIEDDGVDNLEVPLRGETNYFRRDVLDENNQPLF